MAYTKRDFITMQGDHLYWDRFGKQFGWTLKGFSSRYSGSFQLATSTEIVQISGTMADEIQKTLDNQ